VQVSVLIPYLLLTKNGLFSLIENFMPLVMAIWDFFPAKELQDIVEESNHFPGMILQNLVISLHFFPTKLEWLILFVKWIVLDQVSNLNFEQNWTYCSV